MSEHRNHLYKYYDYEGLKATLQNGARLWSYPQGLLEPAARGMRVKWEYGGMQEIIMACLRKQNNPHGKSLGIDYEKFLDRMTKGVLQPEIFVKDLKAAFNAEVAQLGPQTLVCCFTQNKHSLPMWAFYGENHRGGVIKFADFAKTNSPLLEARKVAYQNERPKCKLAKAIEDDDGSYIAEVLRQIMLTKALDWQYEDEWRAVQLEAPQEVPEAIAPDAEQIKLGRKLLPFAKEEVAAIYLGMDMPFERREEIMALMDEKYPHAEIYAAVTHTKELMLEFEHIKIVESLDL